MIDKILGKYGENHQLNIAIEEMAELTKCITKYFRNPKKELHYDHIKEELADVLIMCLQIQEIFGISFEELEREMDYKVSRTVERMKDD